MIPERLDGRRGDAARGCETIREGGLFGGLQCSAEDTELSTLRTLLVIFHFPFLIFHLEDPPGIEVSDML